MSVTVHKDKPNDESYSIGISKHIPENSVNLAYVAAPEISTSNISIVTEPVGVNFKEGYSEEDNLYHVKDDTSMIAKVYNQDILVTDEFSIKKYPDEVPEPLFYKASLKRTIPGSRVTGNTKYVPYQYGYSLKTEDAIRSENTIRNANEVTPLVYRETYENGYNNIVNITTDDGKKVLSGFKFKMSKEGDSSYSVDIYNNFDQDKVYRATYIDSEGNQITEILESSFLFTRVSYEDFASKIGTNEYWMAREYAVKQNGKEYEIYAPTQMMAITDDNRKPFEVKYRVFANFNGNYSKSNPAVINTGMIFLNSNTSEDVSSVLTAFSQSIGTIFPDYITFKNPHPPLRYFTQLDEYKNAPDYWEVDITAPQDYMNDYDIIVITGYGAHDLSSLNDKFAAYLRAGGKIIIDNLSNETLETLNITFGNSEPILSYTMEAPIRTESKEIGTIPAYFSRHYQINPDALSEIGYATGSGPIGPTLTLTNENLYVWEDIARYTNGSRSIAVKTFEERGKILLSNCGLLKGFALGYGTDVKKFLANVILVLAEDIWKVTPWIHDRVYHKSQIYKNEYALDGYIADISPLGGNSIIAKKVIANNVDNFVSYYTGITGLYGKYYIEAYERNSEGNLVQLGSTYMPPKLVSGEQIYVFAKGTNNTSFNITSISGYEEANIHPYFAPVTFKVAITPFTYKWNNVGSAIVQQIIEAPSTNRTKLSYTITKDQGFVNMGFLSVLLPPLPGGPDWVDKSNVFFKIEVSGNEEIDGSFINSKENRVNLYIYDKLTGKYIYTSNSDNVIPYNELYTWREVQRMETGGVVMRQKYNDIILQASTNYYELTASKRTYSIQSNITRDNMVVLPMSLNVDESWFPKIRYMRFSKKSFNKDDYDRIAKTLGFKYDKEYILEKAIEYFGITPQDDRVAQIIAKLDNDEIVDVEDSAILAEAFELMNEEATFEYDIVEYFNQPWNEYPYKKVTDERAKYIDSSTIKIQYVPMNVNMGHQSGEVLQMVAPTLYKAQKENWLPSSGVSIQMETEVPGVWEDMQSGVAIDYSNGIVLFNTPPVRTVRANYSYSNIKVIKRTYTNSIANEEELTNLQDKTYIINDALDRVILRNPNPRVFIKYTDGTTKVLAPGSYTIDYNLGIVYTKNSETGTLCMTYTYANVEYIEVKDYDAKHGTLELSSSIHFNDDVFVSYVFREDYYEYMGYYDRALDKFMHVDLNPTRGHQCTYPVVKDGAISYREVPTYKLLGKTLYLYMIPHRTVVGGSETVEDTTIRHTFSEEDLVLLQMAHPELIVIGSIKLINNYTQYDVTTLDTRKRGGGLVESLSNEKIEKTDELSLNLWDISPFDGRSFHPNGITVVKIPKTVLIEHGGKFTQSEVSDIVYKHLALGVMPIIKYY